MKRRIDELKVDGEDDDRRRTSMEGQRKLENRMTERVIFTVSVNIVKHVQRL